MNERIVLAASGDKKCDVYVRSYADRDTKGHEKCGLEQNGSVKKRNGTRVYRAAQE